jgi:hypothetical protein
MRLNPRHSVSDTDISEIVAEFNFYLPASNDLSMYELNTFIYKS